MITRSRESAAMLQKHGWGEHSIARALYVHAFRHKHLVVVPNCYYTGFEADLLVVRDDLRLMDIEIKISRSDLKADKHKDKWRRSTGGFTPMYNAAPKMHWEPREWPRMIWKHYYCMPREIWTDELLSEIPERSGILFIRDSHPYTNTVGKTPVISVKRQAKPNKDAKPIKPENVIKLAHNCSVRMWAAMGLEQSVLERPSLPGDDHVAGTLGADAELVSQVGDAL